MRSILINTEPKITPDREHYQQLICGLNYAVQDCRGFGESPQLLKDQTAYSAYAEQCTG